ncbi:conserved hypothetical protein [Culex quinquefasciatus]|uniref:Uncharacterized protein n=1 Tax=Culex quinquefasciatus TaxID=7176 RepID=B0WEQ2_CULQU|nr:conserved hypothetical protein [Culex quinquefasciatus]|eukprot:XP_001847186.1 conserved hypothetical protein [Culex quinquefasciatus]
MAPSSVLIVLAGLVSLSQSSEIVPPLYRYDDYDRCRQGNDHTAAGVYCFVKVVFEEDRDPFDSPRIISDFRRNLLDWGVCVEECQRELTDVSLEDRQRLFEPKFPINFTLFNVLKMARIPMLLLAFVPTFIFYQFEIPRPSWLTLIHSVLYRNAAVIAASVTFVDCFQKPQGVVRRFLASKALTSLGKLTYSLHLVHVPVFRLISNWLPPMLEMKLL